MGIHRVSMRSSSLPSNTNNGAACPSIDASTSKREVVPGTSALAVANVDVTIDMIAAFPLPPDDIAESSATGLCREMLRLVQS